LTGKTLNKQPKIFYGYWIVVATFICVFLWSGLGIYIFSLFTSSLQTDFGWGRGDIMLGFTINFLIFGIFSPTAGNLADRYGASKVIALGAIVIGLGFAFLSLINQMWQFYIGWAIVGIGMAAIGTVPSTAVVSKWFERKRGTALGIMSAGIGAGGMVMAPFVGGYLIPTFEWRTTYLILGIITCVILVPLALFVIKAKPGEIEPSPDDRDSAEPQAVSDTPVPVFKGITLKTAITTSSFWLIAISISLTLFSHVGANQSQVPFLEDSGFPVAMAASSLAGVGLGSTIGKFAFGWLCDYIPPKYACAIGMLLQMGALMILVNIQPSSSLALVWVYAIMLGLGMGSWLPTASMLASTTFGLKSYGSIFGMINFFLCVGASTGPLVAGYIYDLTGTYHLVFIIFIALYIVAIPSVLLVPHPPASGAK